MLAWKWTDSNDNILLQFQLQTQTQYEIICVAKFVIHLFVFFYRIKNGFYESY